MCQPGRWRSRYTRGRCRHRDTGGRLSWVSTVVLCTVLCLSDQEVTVVESAVAFALPAMEGVSKDELQACPCQIATNN